MTQLQRIANDLMPFPSMFTNMLDVDRFFGNDPFFSRAERLPATNIKDKNDLYEIEVAAPGMKKEDFKINIDNEVLTISAEHEEEKKEEKDNYTRREFSYNSFSRSFNVPTGVNTEKIDAQYKDGVLMLRLPKKQEAMVSNKKEIKVS